MAQDIKNNLRAKMANKLNDSQFDNPELISRRSFFIYGAKLCVLALISCKAFYMQFIQRNKYKILSQKNRIKTIIIEPLRGKIFDQNNNIIADNQLCYNLVIDKSVNAKHISKDLIILQNLLQISKERFQYIEKLIKKSSFKAPVIILHKLNWRQISIIEEIKFQLKSALIKSGYYRRYYYPLSMCHLIGYLGKINQKEQQIFTINNNNILVGKTGIERKYQNQMQGYFGYKQIEVNAKGSYIRSIMQNNAHNGVDLNLNIDSNLQKQVSNMLDPQGSSAIVMDLNDGSIAACCSTPQFDLNKFSNLTTKYWNKIINDPNLPLIDKTIKAQYPPGSVFKLVTIFAALEDNIDPYEIRFCKGSPFVGQNAFRCIRRQGHGNLNMFDAIKYSCNHYIYSIAKQIGPTKIINMARRFGFGQKTNIDLPGEIAGFLPSPEWKKSHLKSSWTLGDSLNLSMGQGFLSVTPMQLSRFITAIATNGLLFTPKINKSQKTEYSKLNIKQEYFDIVKKALYNVTNQFGGTAYKYSKTSNQNKEISGKTGTAQIMAKKNTDDDLSSFDIDRYRRNHGVFIGYGPSFNPAYSVTIFANHGGYGSRGGALVARKIFDIIL